MTEEETKEFNKLLLSIINHKNKKMIEIEKSEYIAMIPLMDVLAKFKTFVNYIKSKESK